MWLGGALFCALFVSLKKCVDCLKIITLLAVMLDVADQIELDLKDRFVKIQSEARGDSLCRTDPDKWLAVAVDVYKGLPVTGVTKKHRVNQRVYYNIRKQILDIQNKYLKHQLDNLDANIDASDDATAELLEVLNDSIANLKSNRNPDVAKVTESIAASLERLQKSSVGMSMRKNKLLDKPDIVVEKRGPGIDYEARKKELIEIGRAEAKMKKAKAIDITEEEEINV